MQYEDAKYLRQKWKDNGNKVCTHPSIEKEYYLGAQTGDYVCTTCGYTATKETFERLRQQAKQKSEQ